MNLKRIICWLRGHHNYKPMLYGGTVHYWYPEQDRYYTAYVCETCGVRLSTPGGISAF